MKQIFLILGLIVLSSCVSSSWVKRDYSNREGIISYLNQGADFVIDQRINDAQSKMKSFCNGAFEILEESSSSRYMGTFTNSNLGYNSLNTSSYQMTSQYNYLLFRCKN